MAQSTATAKKGHSVKRYESLFIFKNPTKEDGIKDVIDKVSADIASAGGKIETVQKMDKRAFTRVADKRHPSGHYVNIIFSSGPQSIAGLRKQLALNEEVLRAIFTLAPAPKPAK
jgi:ribosomal protein S6